MRDFLGQFINIFTQLLIFAIFARVVLSWLSASSMNRINRILFEATEPLLRPIRSIIPRLGMFDISPIVAVLLLDFLRSIILHYV